MSDSDDSPFSGESEVRNDAFEVLNYFFCDARKPRALSYKEKIHY